MKTYILAVTLAVGLLATSSVANETGFCTLRFNNPPSLLTFQFCKAAAEQGDANAQYNLGYFYSFGHGVEQNIEQAVRWLTMAAEQDFESEQAIGILNAQYQLGEMYQYGWLVKKDIDEAVQWYAKAAMHGNWDSVYELASLASAQNRLDPNGELQARLDVVNAWNADLRKRIEVDYTENSKVSELRSEFEEREAQLEARLDAANTSNAELRKRIEVDYTENSNASELRSEFEEREAQLQASLDAANTSNAELRKRIEVDYTENFQVSKLKSEFEEREAQLQDRLDAANTSNAELRKRVEVDYTENSKVSELMSDLNGRIIELDLQLDAVNTTNVELRKRIENDYVAQDDYQIRVAQVSALNNQIVELREEIDKERRRRAETNALFMNFREECSTEYACADAMDIDYVSNE